MALLVSPVHWKPLVLRYMYLPSNMYRICLQVTCVKLTLMIVNSMDVRMVPLVQIWSMVLNASVLLDSRDQTVLWVQLNISQAWIIVLVTKESKNLCFHTFHRITLMNVQLHHAITKAPVRMESMVSPVSAHLGGLVMCATSTFPSVIHRHVLMEEPVVISVMDTTVREWLFHSSLLCSTFTLQMREA